MSKRSLKIILWVIVGLVLIQFIPVDTVNKPIKASDNFVDVFKTPTHLQANLKTSCYDCHSNETIYPSYAMFAPVSWSIKANVNKGRTFLNFSEWGTYNQDIKRSSLKNILSALENNTMPTQGYLAQHPESNLSKEEKAELIQYFKKILDSNSF